MLIQPYGISVLLKKPDILYTMQIIQYYMAHRVQNNLPETDLLQNRTRETLYFPLSTYS